MFSNELCIKSLMSFSLLYAFKSYIWTLDIKAQKEPSKRMLISTAVVLSGAILLTMPTVKGRHMITQLQGMEYILVVLDILKNQSMILMDLRNIEEKRTLLVFIVNIIHLALKTVTFGVFVVRFSIRARVPYGIVKSLAVTVMKLCKKVVLFKKYVTLLIDLESIEEVTVEDTCAICTEQIEKGKRLQCSHVFHSSCLKMWCEREISCPICRSELVFRKETIHETEDEILSGIPIELEE